MMLQILSVFLLPLLCPLARSLARSLTGWLTGKGPSGKQSHRGIAPSEYFLLPVWERESENFEAELWTVDFVFADTCNDVCSFFLATVRRE